MKAIPRTASHQQFKTIAAKQPVAIRIVAILTGFPRELSIASRRINIPRLTVKRIANGTMTDATMVSASIRIDASSFVGCGYSRRRFQWQ